MLKTKVFLGEKEIKSKDKDSYVIINPKINKILESVLDECKTEEKTA